MKRFIAVLIAALLLCSCAPAQKEKIENDSNVKVVVDDILIEAESGDLFGNASIAGDKSGFSGSGYVTGFKNTDDGVELSVSIPYGCHYDFVFYINSNGQYKENKIWIDGGKAADVISECNGFEECIVEKLWLDEGDHKIKLTTGWGWVDFDKLIIHQSDMLGEETYNLSAELCNPNATKEAKSLYNYLLSIYGKYTLAGQHSTEGMNSVEFASIKEKTGKVPALIEIDIMKMATPYSSDFNNVDMYFDRVKEFNKKGGIVVLNWHWHAPPPYLYDDSERPWWKGFYTEATNIDLEKIMSGEDEKGLELLNEDIDVVAQLFKKLQDKKIPVLFRPLHEAGGGWFWWGAKGAEPFKELYIHLYDRLTNHHGLNNIIWVWNGDDPEWYPGDEYVDIASTDIYADEGEYSSQINDFIAVGEASNGKKPIALSENGVQVDPDMMTRDNVYWLYFCTWGGEYCTTDQYTSDEMFQKVFNAENVITLDELPNWRRY